MKFTRLCLSLNLKAFLLLTLLLSNIIVSAHETIKIQKTISKYERKRIQAQNARSSSSSKGKNTTLARTSLDFKEKFKAFLVGFLAVVAVKALKLAEDGVLKTMVVAAVDWCFEVTVNEYEEVKKKIIKDSPCNGDIIKELLGKDYPEIQSKCALLETARKMDSSEFSGLNVLLGKLSGIFTDNKEFEDAYAKFKTDKTSLEKLSENWTETYKKKFADLKADKKNTPKQVRKVARTLFKAMDGIIFKKDLCEAVRDCSDFGPMDHLKVIYGSSIGFLKCAATAQVKNPLWYGMEAIVKTIFNQLGSGLLTSIAAGIFPGILLGLLVKFVISNWSAMKQFVDSFLKLKTDDPSTWNAERDLWNSIGRLLAGLLFSIVGAKKRKLKKFRKFDEKLF